MYTKDSTSHMQIRDAIKNGSEVTQGKVGQWRQCDSCMKEFNVDINEIPLHVTRDCPRYAHFRQELYRASTEGQHASGVQASPPGIKMSTP